MGRTDGRTTGTMQVGRTDGRETGTMKAGHTDRRGQFDGWSGRLGGQAEAMSRNCKMQFPE
ncbi:hypothetical protein [Paenibacillus cisolokensis]|uniref:hypothetical protein n=1 Tax=Paenibacillus cisolokensis TaxID=1658519 RepID=UPI001BCD07BA|nr:hypothetical protein [Paenibacillus cisolokensis]